MVFKSFRVNIFARLAVILILGYTGMYVLTQTYFWLVSIWLFLFMLISFLDLVKFIERSKRELSNFLLAIQQNDFSNTYSLKALDTNDFELHYAYTTITDEFQKLRREKESNYHFLQAVVEHSGIPLIGFKENNLEITLMNDAAKELFQKPYLKNAKAISKIDRKLGKCVLELKSGERELLKILVNNKLLSLSIIAKELKLDDELYKLVSFQNIKAELDEQELESWQKLIRVLTHEIKNSAIPISTLTEVVNQMITENNGELKDLSTLDQEDLADLKIGLKTVQKRSKGLVSFVNAYGELAKIPQPKFQKVDLKQLTNDVVTLLQHDMKKSNITLKNEVQANLMQIDPELVEQVLINLIKNAKEAVHGREQGKIVVRSTTEAGRTLLSVIDNGSGIDTETLENIFVPFFTTKKEGSGIGLSLSRQIMRAHKGDLVVQSQLDKGSEFSLVF
ncbi:MAG: ATP-binding protein [Bacteroidota bacterium]